MTCWASSTGTLVKRLTTSKLTRVSGDRRFIDFNNCTTGSNGFRLAGKRTQYLMEKTSQGIERGTNRTHYKPQRNARFVNLGKT
jgi:hypothetical protein